MKCTNCAVENPPGEARPNNPQWWFLSNYFGISGTFCPDCYELVSHTPYGVPRHPVSYQQIKEKQT